MNLPCSWLLLYMYTIDWFQAFWVGPTLLFIRNPRKSTKSRQCHQDTSTQILKYRYKFREELSFFNKSKTWYVHKMYMLSVFLLFRTSDKFSGVVRHVLLTAIMYLYLIIHFVFTGEGYNFRKNSAVVQKYFDALSCFFS